MLTAILCHGIPSLFREIRTHLCIFAENLISKGPTIKVVKDMSESPYTAGIGNILIFDLFGTGILKRTHQEVSV